MSLLVKKWLGQRVLQSNTSVQQTYGECDICPSEESASGSMVEEPDVPNGSIVEEPEVQNATIGQNSEGDNGQELSLDRCDTKSGGFWKAGARFSGVDETTGQFVSGKIIEPVRQEAETETAITFKGMMAGEGGSIFDTSKVSL